jgi:hypothetical protein
MEVPGMANIWRVYEGREPTVGEPWVRMPLAAVVAAFDLSPADFVSDLEHTPRFGDEKRDLRHLGFRHVVVEVEDSEAQLASWRPGFYEARVKPGEAPGRLLRQALTEQLGEENVVRVELYLTTDSEDREALRVTVAIPPRATPRLKARVLDALVAVRERLRDMGDDRTPIIEYATEAELADGDAQP